jgi:hypothetical protein
MGLRSKISVARPGSPSLRATIPEGIVAFLGVKEGDKVDWEMQVSGEKRSVTVTKVEPILDEVTIKKAVNYVSQQSGAKR